MSGTRKIYKGAVTSQHAVREVLTMVFAQELLAPCEVEEPEAPAWPTSCSTLT